MRISSPRRSGAATSRTQPSSASAISAVWPSRSWIPSIAEALGQRRRRRVDLDFDESIVGADVDGQLTKVVAALTDAVDGQGVEHLVGQDDAIERRRQRGHEASAETGIGQTLPQLGDPALIDLDGVVADLRRQRREHRHGQRTLAGTVLHDAERFRSTEGHPGVVDRTREQLAEDRMELGRRDEVAAAARACLGGAVIATIGVVERQLHEASERHRPRGADLRSHALGKPGVVGEVGQIGRGLATELGSEAGHGRILSTAPQRQRQARSDQV